jgi:outer membrane protein assembly factor BamB
MQTCSPIRRHVTPFRRPQAIAFQGPRLWISSLDTRRIYALDPADFSVLKSHEAPGKPYGMTAIGNELGVLCGVGEDDNRFVYRFRDGAFLPDPIPCPDDTGSHLAFDGEHLYISQWYRRRLVAVDDQGQVLRRVDAPEHGVAGQVIVDGSAYLLGTDDENEGPYYITRLDLATGESTDLAKVPNFCRGLAFDGTLFWSNIREQGEAIGFTLPV